METGMEQPNMGETTGLVPSTSSRHLGNLPRSMNSAEATVAILLPPWFRGPMMISTERLSLEVLLMTARFSGSHLRERSRYSQGSTALETAGIPILQLFKRQTAISLARLLAGAAPNGERYTS